MLRRNGRFKASTTKSISSKNSDTTPVMRNRGGRRPTPRKTQYVRPSMAVRPANEVVDDHTTANATHFSLHLQNAEDDDISQITDMDFKHMDRGYMPGDHNPPHYPHHYNNNHHPSHHQMRTYQEEEEDDHEHSGHLSGSGHMSGHFSGGYDRAESPSSEPSNPNAAASSRNHPTPGGPVPSGAESVQSNGGSGSGGNPFFTFRRAVEAASFRETTLFAKVEEECMSDLVKRLQDLARSKESGVLRFRKEEQLEIRDGKKKIIFVLPQLNKAKFTTDEFGQMKAADFLQLTRQRPILVDIETEEVVDGEALDIF